MRIILSRKGFDSALGGVPSPVLPDGTLVSLPIPYAHSPYTYGDLRAAGLDAGRLVEQLTRGRLPRTQHTHLDPDLRADSLPRPAGWRPLFGQAGAAQTHLARQGVGPGDLFLFFGWFRQTERVHGAYRYARSAPDLHVIYGWLQVERVVPLPAGARELPAWAAGHVHLHGDYGPKSTLYVSGPELRPAGLARPTAGASVFPRLCDPLVLTAPAGRRATWRLPSWFLSGEGEPGLSYNTRRERWRAEGDWCTLRSAAQGQEFVLDAERHPEAIGWAAALLESTA